MGRDGRRIGWPGVGRPPPKPAGREGRVMRPVLCVTQERGGGLMIGMRWPAPGVEMAGPGVGPGPGRGPGGVQTGLHSTGLYYTTFVTGMG